MENTKTLDFSTTFTVEQSPSQVFEAITNPRGWWSEAIVGNTTQIGDEFGYQYEDLHRCKMRLVELVPNQKVVWLVLENEFKFTQDKTEWIGNHISFEITQIGEQTQVDFTQMGLVPAYECYAICSDAWTNYIQNSLRRLIETGTGLPNGKGKPRTANELKKNAQDYHIQIATSAAPEAVFNAINKVPAWWSTHFEGSASEVGDIYTVTFGETWISVQVVELIPFQKILWRVEDCHKHWLKDKKEWKGTWMLWEIAEENGETKIDFTHIGLVPGIECYNGCEKAWDFYIRESLLGLLNAGKGMPEGE